MEIPCSALLYRMPGGVLGPYEISAYKCKPKQQADVPLWAALVEADSPTVWAVNSTRHH